MRSPLVMISLLVAAGCSSEPVTVTFEEATDGLARFTIENRSEQDVRSISFELSFRSQAGDLAHIDTVTYTSKTNAEGDVSAFVRAGDETFFVSKLPPSSVSASATVIEITFWDGTAWPEQP